MDGEERMALYFQGKQYRGGNVYGVPSKTGATEAATWLREKDLIGMEGVDQMEMVVLWAVQYSNFPTGTS